MGRTSNCGRENSRNRAGNECYSGEFLVRCWVLSTPNNWNFGMNAAREQLPEHLGYTLPECWRQGIPCQTKMALTQDV